MTTKKQRQRGKRTHGWGSQKKHRGGGSRGGRGLSGLKKHKRTWMVKNAPKHLGKKGFKSLTDRKIKPKQKVINLREVNKFLDGKLKELDLGNLGYDKLLSTGELSSPISIKVSAYSAKAKEKVEAIGGKILE